MYECTNTKWCFIRNLVRIGRSLFLRLIWIFFIVISNFKISMYPWSLLCEETKIKQYTHSKKKLRKIGEETIWESRFTYFFLYRQSSFLATCVQSYRFLRGKSRKLAHTNTIIARKLATLLQRNYWQLTLFASYCFLAIKNIFKLPKVSVR